MTYIVEGRQHHNFWKVVMVTHTGKRDVEEQVDVSLSSLSPQSASSFFQMPPCWPAVQALPRQRQRTSTDFSPSLQVVPLQHRNLSGSFSELPANSDLSTEVSTSGGPVNDSSLTFQLSFMASPSSLKDWPGFRGS